MSYATADLPAVSAITNELTNRGIELWMDREGLLAGSKLGWNPQLANMIEAAPAILFMASPRSVVRPEVQAEINFALHRGRPIIVVELEAFSRFPNELNMRLTTAQRVKPHAPGGLIGGIMAALAEHGLASASHIPGAGRDTWRASLDDVRPKFRELRAWPKDRVQAEVAEMRRALGFSVKKAYLVISLAVLLMHGEDYAAANDLFDSHRSELAGLPERGYFHSIARLAGVPPRQSRLNVVRAIENDLSIAISQDARSHYYFLLAIIASDYHERNGMRSSLGGSIQLLERGLALRRDIEEEARLLALVRCPNQMIYSRIES